MAHFAEIDEKNNVLRVQVINNEDIAGGDFPESEPLGQAFQSSLGIEGTWLQCSYSGSFRGSYPGPGWKWSPNKRRKDGGIFEPPATPATK
jgi:hypothetical protein